MGQIRVGETLLIKTRRSTHENFCQCLKQTPVSMFIGIGQIGAGKTTAKSQVIEQDLLGLEAGDDIAQTLPIGQLAETQRQELIILSESSGGAPNGE